MNKNMPAFAVFHHRFFLGYVSAVSMRQAKERAAKRFPAKRLEVEVALNVPATAKDILEANNTYQAKRS